MCSSDLADGTALTVAGASLAVGTVQRDVVSSSRGARVQVGVRPEDLAPGAAGIPACVELVEPLGSETLVHWSSEAGALVSRVTTGAVPRVGDRAQLTGRPDALLIFEASSGRALLETDTLLDAR